MTGRRAATSTATATALAGSAPSSSSSSSASVDDAASTSRVKTPPPGDDDGGHALRRSRSKGSAKAAPAAPAKTEADDTAKVESDDVAVAEAAADGDGAAAGPSSDEGSQRRQRSSSMKELAGLGLANLGEAEALAPRRSKRAAPTSPTAEPVADTTMAVVEEPEAEAEEGDIEGVTRCVCGSSDENVGLMIQCETCRCWQHCVCMGMNTEEDCPDVYYCEQCRPELHITLLRVLGFLPAKSSNGKKGSKSYSSKNPTRDSARELRDAKAAVALLAQQNAERRRLGGEPIVANTAGRPMNEAGMVDEAAGGVPASPRNAPGAGHRSPKRRSTMNSRDSMYGGWEAIPPGLLNEDEVWEEEDGTGKKRKRTGAKQEESSTSLSHSRSPSPSAADQSKRRRMSSSQQGGRAADSDEVASKKGAPSGSAAGSSGKGKAATRNNGDEAAPAPVTKPKQPNQYTYRKERAALAAAANGNRPPSPTPSPSKSGRRGGASTLREGTGSRAGTPLLHAGTGKNSSWGMPEHLSHLAHLLPSPQPESLLVHMPSTKGLNHARSNQDVDHGTRPSPHAFTVLDLSEPPTKVRFPGKRMTMGEMRKRVRNISDYITRTQLEALERGKRMKLLGIPTGGSSTPSSSGSQSGSASKRDSPAAAVKAPGDGVAESSEAGAEGSGATSSDTATPPQQQQQAQGGVAAGSVDPPSMRLLDDLTRELIAFQQKFGMPPGSGGFTAYAPTPARERDDEAVAS